MKKKIYFLIIGVLFIGDVQQILIIYFINHQNKTNEKKFKSKYK
jgi:hypothetical protein